MFGYKIISEKEYNKLQNVQQVQQEINFAPSQDYQAVSDALVVQLDRFMNHPAAIKSFMHKFVDAMEEIWDEDKVRMMLSKISSVINQRMR